jgi:flagellar L-ring protein precursor FlgH
MKKELALSCLISLFVALQPLSLAADSLWDSQRPNVYSVSQKRIHVGDIVTIAISESTSAVQEATTQTQKQSGLGANLLSAWNQVANVLGNETIRKQYDSSLAGNDSFRGNGQTSRRSKVEATITAIVTEVLDGGNLFIVGEHKVKVNDEVETIRISGIIRPGDILPNNTVLSSQIAKAEVSVNGNGVVGAKQTPGMMTKMFNWLF